jgi:uncharacterized cupredoxin-like copper-binding protein
MARLALPVLCLALAACATTHPITPQVAASDSLFANARTVEVSLSNFDFTPRHIQLEAGVPYALHFVNTASGGHDFTAPEFFAAARVAPGDSAAIAGGQVELAGGQDKTIRLIPAAGTYKLACTHLGHAALGMTGDIAVR